MKNYELISRLMELPAGYDVKLYKAIGVEEFEENDTLELDEVVKEANADTIENAIILLI